jgi:ABC-type sugar transport system ATPase subunit
MTWACVIRPRQRSASYFGTTLGVLESVGELVRSVSSQGVPVLLITHNLPQVHRLADRVAVLFHGHVVADLRRSDVIVDDMVSWITGAALGTQRHAG